ncbi:hypothetical protein O1611_g6848 [Lasiodiplodia mahajangana]|uniref:Uncharacterized protein n=1 Tax=Lasiodiplodia mahajangana TaxID=1108764 RepID=A0ACC2JH52_9PEZI|nr:hypothetical protein O1611_g6848 [Lasiodiplodia mahajangana]
MTSALPPGSRDSTDSAGYVDEPSPIKTRNRKWSSVFFIIKDAVLIIITIVAITVALAKNHEPTRNSCYCGNSIAEAHALGCEYDTLASAWLPQHCIDKELTAEFDRSGDGPNGTWQYWADYSHERELTLDQLAALAEVPGAIYYTSSQWHVVHCIFYWRKQMRLPRTGVTLEPRYNHEGHAKHCGMIFRYPNLGSQAGVVLDSDIF